ncbi:MAG: SpoIIE family protein phosphatase, partial [Lachnospiraceae bacterium]|nr:SpoIIE family protein phosphatase [Lachnospiraceae bacterium]
MEHLFDYWESNYEKMNYYNPQERNREASVEWANSHEEVADKCLAELEFLTPADFDKLTEEEKRLMAEYLYTFYNSAIATIVSDRLGKDDIAYDVFKFIGDDKAFVWFGKFLGEDRKAILGEILPFTLSKHPVASGILETGEKPEKTEHIVSTVDGEEYFYAVWPILIDGNLKGLVGIQYRWSETKNNLISRMLQAGGRVLLYMLIADVLLLILLNWAVLRPVKRVQQRLRDYSTDKDSSHVEQGLAKINKKQDEVGSLSRDFTDLTKEMDRYIDEVYTLAGEKAAVGAELSVATRIQADMLPCVFPAFPERTDFDIFASMTPAKEVGGDFYDFFLLDDDHLAMVMADVSEKGVPAALFMVISRTLIKFTTQMCSSPKEILEEVNNRLYANNAEGMFVTVWLGILEISTGKIIAVNAGHEYPVIRKAGGRFELLKDKHGMMAGAMPGLKYT